MNEKHYLSESLDENKSYGEINLIALSIKIIGFLIIILTILGGLYFKIYAFGLIPQSIYIYMILGGIVCGILFIGFGEIVQCLHDIRLKD